MRRLISLLLALCCLLPTFAHAASPDAPTSLRTADTVKEVNSFLLEPVNGELPEVQPGMIRYITLNNADRSFLSSCWKSSRFNLLSRTDFDGKQYKIDYRHMHSRAVYCMALSYLGIDVTPVMMESCFCVSFVCCTIHFNSCFNCCNVVAIYNCVSDCYNNLDLCFYWFITIAQ